MFVRKKNNVSGVISVQILEKRNGKSHLVKTIGSSSDPNQVELLFQKGKQLIKHYKGEIDLFDQSNIDELEENAANDLLSNIESVLINGTQLLLEKVYNSIGFNDLGDDILKHLVTARLSQPLSKSGTVAYLKAHFDEDIHYQKIYRYMDKLYNSRQDEIQRISVEHTRKILGGSIGLLFYDVTTLYFETDHGDDLREKGFSKDGKHAQPQIVLGLLVSRDGYPLSYSIFNGSQYEGRTMIPIVDDFIRKNNLDDFVIVADSGLLNKRNLTLLEASGYKYILGGRIKSVSDKEKEWILSLERKEGVFHERTVNNHRIIIGYSEKRAKKDHYNREKGINRLKKEFGRGKLTKDHVNKKGYNKFLELSNDINVKINEEKIKEDEKWDGLKSYITNTDLPATEVYEQYCGLWVIERAFRVTKGTIELRPMFHFTPRRIEAHVAICFVAYKVYKELERIIKVKKIDLSVDKVIEIAKTITTIKIRLPNKNKTLNKTLLITPLQQKIASLLDENISH